MPRFRLLADLAQANGSAIDGASNAGDPVFQVPAGDVVKLELDATGWAGPDSVTGSEWESPDGVIISARTLSGKVAACNAYVPEPPEVWSVRGYRVHNTLTTDSGLVRKTTVWLRSWRRRGQDW